MVHGLFVLFEVVVIAGLLIAGGVLLLFLFGLAYDAVDRRRHGGQRASEVCSPPKHWHEPPPR
jgi:hypothetical protein